MVRYSGEQFKEWGMSMMYGEEEQSIQGTGGES